MKNIIFVGSILLAVSALFYTFNLLQKDRYSAYQKVERPLPTSSVDNINIDLNKSKTDETLQSSYLSFIAKTPSLNGTQVDGEFSFDNNGKLIITGQVRYVFEYFLSSLNDKNYDDIRQALSGYAATKLSKSDHHMLMGLYDNYMNARSMDSTRSFTGQPASMDNEGLDTLQSHFQDLKQHRRQFLSAEHADLFFSEEEAYDEFSINRLQIIQNALLSDNEKKQAINELNESLPDAQKDIRHSINLSNDLDNTLAQLREDEATEEEIYHARAQTIGHDKADRLRQYEARETLWNKRYQQHLIQKKNIMESSGLSDQDKNKQVIQLLEQDFSNAEIKEIKRLEIVALAKNVANI